jgi:hypothetical protein
VGQRLTEAIHPSNTCGVGSPQVWVVDLGGPDLILGQRQDQRGLLCERLENAVRLMRG